MASTGQNFEIYQGNTRDVVIEVLDSDTGLPVSLSGYSVRWVVYEQTSKAIVLQKASGGTGITVPNPTDGKIIIALDAADTQNLTPKVYNHECEIYISTTSVITVSVGTMNVILSKA
jgi:hypothetical protein